jgi:hypothetical protein
VPRPQTRNRKKCNKKTSVLEIGHKYALFKDGCNIFFIFIRGATLFCGLTVQNNCAALFAEYWETKVPEYSSQLTLVLRRGILGKRNFVSFYKKTKLCSF